jgi:putative toxin-antitoxin system antitoxin component (TIGR02293 family)
MPSKLDVPGRKPPAGKAAALARLSLEQVFQWPPQARIEAIRRGVPAAHLSALAARMALPAASLIDTLGLSRTRVNRLARAHRALSPAESERVLGMESLIGQVDHMVTESGNTAGFDAAQWVAGWLTQPLPALGHQAPACYLDTIEGQRLVSHCLAMAQGGAYA